MGNDFLDEFFGNDFLGFGKPQLDFYNAAGTKDVKPAVWYKAKVNDNAKYDEYVAICRSVGVDAQDIKVTIPDMLVAMSANILGLGNACTPLGLKAMGHLQELNGDKETASDAMCTFMAITSSSLTIIPTTIIALRLTHGSASPTEIIGPVIFATTCSTLTAVLVDALLRRVSKRR